jgi:signal transduction histidine kinase
MRLSLRHRLMIPLGVLLLADAAATAWAARVAAREAEARIRSQLVRVVQTLTEPPTFPLTPRVLEQMRGFSGAEFVLVKRGGETTGTFSRPGGFAPSRDDTHWTVDGETYRVERVALPENHPNAGGTLYVGYPESAQRSAVRDAMRPAIISGGAIAVVAVILAWLGSRFVGRLRDLERQTRRIAEGDFRTVPPSEGRDELGDLARSIQEMARRLEGYQAELQRTERLRVLGEFSGGLAHQLRNAAAGARLAVQLYLGDLRAAASPSDPDREPLEVALRQLARIESNLRQFLSLGKPAPTDMKPCDWTEILDTAVRLLQPQCRHAGIELAWSKPAPVGRNGDATLLGHLFGNLIGNAIDAAGPGGRVEVLWLGDAVEVIDSGSGPPPQIAGRLFEPFVTGRDQGIGLGLAVARQAAEAHGCEITWERREGKTVFRVGFEGSK